MSVRNGQLYIQNVGTEALIQMTLSHRNWAINLTHQELALKYVTGLSQLYSAIAITPASRAIFDGVVVDRGRGLIQLK
jgi:hypothetical protein